MSLVKDEFQETIDVAKLQAVFPTAGTLLNKWSYLHVSYKPVGYYIQIIPLKGEKFW